MLKILFCFPLLLILGCEKKSDPVKSDVFELIFQDDFNTMPAPPVWEHFYGLHGTEPQIHTDHPSNVNVSNGMLHLICKKEDILHDNKVFHFTSAWVQTKEKYRYGYFEARARCPEGKGYWPAFWLQWGAALLCSYTEIDIFENDGGNLRYISNNLMFQTMKDCDNGPYSRTTTTDPLFIHNFPFDLKGYHTWGLAWTPSTITFYLDSIKLRTVHHTNFHQAMPVIFDLALYPYDDGYKRGPDSTTPATGSFDIDYLKVYRWKEGE